MEGEEEGSQGKDGGKRGVARKGIGGVDTWE
jgi:hypothetical protein